MTPTAKDVTASNTRNEHPLIHDMYIGAIDAVPGVFPTRRCTVIAECRLLIDNDPRNVVQAWHLRLQTPIPADFAQTTEDLWECILLPVYSHRPLAGAHSGAVCATICAIKNMEAVQQGRIVMDDVDPRIEADISSHRSRLP
jgi:hypothetical protein